MTRKTKKNKCWRSLSLLSRNNCLIILKTSWMTQIRCTSFCKVQFVKILLKSLSCAIKKNLRKLSDPSLKTKLFSSLLSSRKIYGRSISLRILLITIKASGYVWTGMTIKSKTSKWNMNLNTKRSSFWKNKYICTVSVNKVCLSYKSKILQKNHQLCNLK